MASIDPAQPRTALRAPVPSPADGPAAPEGAAAPAAANDELSVADVKRAATAAVQGARRVGARIAEAMSMQRAKIGALPPVALDPASTDSVLVQTLRQRLPAHRFDAPIQQERILARAARFEEKLAAAGAPGGPLEELKGRLPPGTELEVHGVASHFAPEALQVHARESLWTRRTFVQDSAGSFVERPDLQARLERGQVPSSDPGRPRDAGAATATFAVATPDARGVMRAAVPTDLARFSHAPRAKPFDTGDRVEVAVVTGQSDKSEYGERFTQSRKTTAGELVGHDGAGRWLVRTVDEAGAARTVQVTDKVLRELNNPNLLRKGDRLGGDMAIDPDHADQRAMIAAWRASPDAQALGPRPGPAASAGERAAWEERGVRASARWVNAALRYPDLTPAEIAAAGARLKGLDEQLKDPDLRVEERSKLEGERSRVARNLEADRRYASTLMDREATNIGTYFTNGTGQCRHQAVAGQLILQDLGIDGRLTSGGVTTADAGHFQGFHLWIEATLSDGRQLLVDPTFSGDVKPLMETQQKDIRHELPTRTRERYGGSLVEVPRPGSRSGLAAHRPGRDVARDTKLA